MSEIVVWYEGNLSTRAVHGDNQAEIVTDAPKESQGLGRVFSPTDLVAVALASCVLTLMGIAANRFNIAIGKTRVVATKKMQAAPQRRISVLHLEIFCPHVFDDAITQALIQAIETCPVSKSLHPEISQEFIYHWGTP
ncbi:MAG: OsmC family protein [Chlamydiota bacterium]